jgi:VanZ family protein
MLPYLLPRPIRLCAYALAVAILLYLCLAPQQELPQTELSDKPEHAIAWFVLTATGLILGPRRPRAIGGFVLALGAVVEVLQGLMRLGRHADWRDLVADVLGAGVAMAGYLVVKRLFR